MVWALRHTELGKRSAGCIPQQAVIILICKIIPELIYNNKIYIILFLDIICLTFFINDNSSFGFIIFSLNHYVNPSKTNRICVI